MVNAAIAAPAASSSITSDTAQAETTVIDSASRFGAQRTVQLLADAGVFADDDTRGAVLIAKRINHALFGDFSKEGLSDALLGQVRTMQEKYRQAISATPYEQLVENGQLNALLVEYINFLLERSREQRKRPERGAAQRPE